METARDKGLAQAAVAQRLVSLEKMQECLDEMKLAEGDGSSATLDELLVKKGLISRRQADGLLEGLARKALPKEIGGFQIIEPVGTGGMHTVYKARQMSMDRIVALKILSPKVAQNNKYVQRLFKEARAVAKLSHPNIIQGIDVGEDLGYFYFAAEFIEGESLGDSLEREHSLGEYNALRIAEQVCLALCHIQQHANMIHGDIKPANIMLTRAGVAKLADLGLARAVGGSEIITAGTPHYISPEQLHNSPDVDIRSDIYSLGATLFHMVTGSPPYLGPNAKAIGLKHISEPIPEVRAPNAQLSLGIRRLITKMLAKDPADRHQTPAEVLNDIHRVQQGMMPAGALVFARVDAHRTASRRSVNPVLPIAIVLIVLGGIAAAVAFSNKGTGPPPPPTSKNVLAAEAYADAVAFEKEHPEALAKVISRYDSVASRYKFTDWGKKAGQRSEEKRTTRQALAETKFLQVKQKADALAAKGRYAEAAAALDEYPRRLRFGEWPDQIRTERRKHRDAARAREEKQLEKAAALADEQHYEEATKVLQPLLESDITDIVRRAEEQIAKYNRAVEDILRKQVDEQFKKADALADEQRYKEAIEMLSPLLESDNKNIAWDAQARIEKYDKDAEDVLRKQAEKLDREYEKLETLVVRRERAREYDLALLECDTFLKDHTDVTPRQRKRLVDDVEELKTEIETARDVWEAIRTALRRKLGQVASIRIAGILLTGTVRDVSDTEFTVETNGGKITKQLSEIDPETLLELAGPGYGRDAVVLRVRFFLAEGDIARAQQAVVTLNDEAAVEAWTARIHRRTEVIRSLDQELKAQELLAEMRACVANKQWKKACKKASDLQRNYANTATVQAAEDELAQTLVTIEPGLAEQLRVKQYRKGKFLSLLETLQDFLEWQVEHACPKDIPCEACKGRGKVLKVFKCPRCLPKSPGKMRCERCGGRGWTFILQRRRCMDCNGAGKVTCPTCGGANKVARPVDCLPCRGVGTFPCPKCNGTGYDGLPSAEHLEAKRVLEEEHNVRFETIKKMLEP